jgi:hypothetical protein
MEMPMSPQSDHDKPEPPKGPPPGHEFTIKIDRAVFKVDAAELTGAALRALPEQPIGPDRDLFEVVPGGSDLKIADDQIVKMRDGLRFFTAPAQINPGTA